MPASSCAERSAPVTREALERELERLQRESGDPRAGLFGPESKLWEVNRSSAVFLGAGRAALLQLAHPWVATAIEQHSHTRQDPVGRFQRTFARVFAMVYGDTGSALEAAREVHTVHTHIEGALSAGGHYLANDPDALLWVHATLWDTSVRMFEAVVRPLTPEEKELYYTETRRFAALFGIPERRLPGDWTAFTAYVEGMLEGELCVLPAAAEMGRFVLHPLHPALAPLMRRYRTLTAHFLPPRLARDFGLGGELGRADAAASSLRLLRRLYPLLPRRLRYLPAYLEALRRLEGREGRDWLGEGLSRLLVGSRGR
jgi:uncharacterized protein (DUF2236 family)